MSIVAEAPRGTMLSGDDDKIVLTEVGWPGTTSVLSKDGEELVKFSIPLGALELEGEPMLPSDWNFLRTLSLGAGFLQTMISRTSNRVVMATYSESGEFRSARLVGIPIVFTDPDLGRQTLIGVRQFNKPEVVVYGWHWGRPDP